MIFEDQNEIMNFNVFFMAINFNILGRDYSYCKERSSLSFSHPFSFPSFFLFPSSFVVPVFIFIVSLSHLTGPVIRAEVGDTIQVMFYNRASQPFSIQPHGVFYEKDYEGTMYNDGEQAGSPTNVGCR